MTFSKIFKKIYHAFDLCPTGKNELFHVHIIEHIRQLPALFDKMLKGQSNIFLHPAYLQAMEESNPVDMHFAYACIERDSKPAAFMYFQLLKIRLDKAEEFLNPKFYGKEIGDLLKGKNNLFFKSNFNSPLYIMFCGNVFLTGEHGIYLDPSQPGHELLEALPLLIQEVVDKAGEAGKVAGVVIKDFYEEKNPGIPVIENKGYRKFYFEPDMIMRIRSNWMDFNDYLNDLSSKYRVRAKNSMKKAEDLVRMEFTENDIVSNAILINRLYKNVHHNAAVHFSEVHADYFSNLKNRLKHNFSFKAFYLEDKMIAFSTMVYGKGYCEAHLVGLDYDFNKSHALYPCLLYDYIKDAIDKRIPVIHFGRTALEIKSTVGAKAAPLYCYIGLQGSLSIKLIAPFMNSSKTKPFIERDPFKEGSIANEPVLKM